MKKSLMFGLKCATTILFSLVLTLTALLVGMRLFGLQIYVVLSGSMEPTYPTGSLIYVKPCAPKDLHVKDVITFQLTDRTIATHRIVNIQTDGGRLIFQTKGDANEQADTSPVYGEQVIGKPVFAIPYLGYLADYIQNPPGSYIAMAVGATIILLMILSDQPIGKSAKNTCREVQPFEKGG